MAGEFVQVIVRCRPLNEREVENDIDVVVTMDTTEQQIVLRHSISSNVNYPRKVFTFDRVFDTDATNEQIYSDVVSPLVDSVLDGYNGCIFAYGQTSCGKTFSMQGNQTPSVQRGIMSRTFEQIFEYIQTTDVTYCVVKASYLEIYNEEIRDLLYKHNTNKLVVKEHPEKGVYVRDLTSVDVMCIEDMEEVLEVGSWNRVFGSTAQNPDSSRSHCIFTIEYELCFTCEEDQKEHFRSGRINLVDLAGSERQRYSRSRGERFKEATKINLSLSALGNVISALVNEKSKHIPYRASKLTRLLQDSLGGNSRTLMIACISPGENNENETLSTLRYANRAKNIKNRPRINEDPKDLLIRQYQKEIKTLRQMLSNHMNYSNESNVMSSALVLHSIDSELDNTEKTIQKRSAVVISKQERLSYEQKIAGLKHKYDLERLSRERIEKGLKAVRAEYDNYRLKHEYKMQKLQSCYKSKLKRLMEERSISTNGDENLASDESAYISAATSDISGNFSHDSFSSDKQDKTALLASPLREISHLWSQQWLKGYCDTPNKRGMSRCIYTPNLLSPDMQCVCLEQLKDIKETEKASQTCELCSRPASYSPHACQESEIVITNQPANSTTETSRQEIKEGEKKFGLCCLLPFISFFGEKVTRKH